MNASLYPLAYARLSCITPALWVTRSALAITIMALLAFFLQPALALHPEAISTYQKGVNAAKAQDWKQAEYWLRQSITIDPTDPLSQVQLGSVLANQGLNEAALEAYQKAASLNSQDPMLYFTIGHLYEQQQNWAMARQAYENALRKHPDYRYGLLSLARVLSQQDDKQRAIDVYRAFLASYPKHVDARRALARELLATDQGKAAATLLEALRQEQADNFQDSLLLGQAFLKAEEPQLALEALDQARQKGDDVGEIAQREALAYEALKQPNRALSAYQEALEKKPENTALRLRMAPLLIESGQAGQAATVLEPYLQAKPDDAKAQWLLAKAYLDTQQFEKASPLLSKLASPEAQNQLTPQARQAVQMQLAYAKQQQGNPQEAIALYERLLNLPNLELNPEDQQTLKRNLALAYHQSGQLQKALPLYRDIVQQQELMASDQAFAESGSNQALKADMADVLVALARETYQKRDFAKAEQYLNEALSLEPNDSNAQLALANLFNATDRTADAKQYYASVLDKDPGNQLAQLYLTRLRKAEGSLDEEAALTIYLQLANSTQPKAGQAFEPSNKEVHVESLLSAAELQIELGQWQPALDTLKKAAAVTSLNALALEQKGTALYQLKRYEEAVSAYEAALKQDPNNATLAYNLGLTRLAQKQWTGATHWFQQALSWQPDLAEAHYGLAMAAENQKQWKTAAQSYETYLKEAKQIDAEQRKELNVRLTWLKQQAGLSLSTDKTVAKPSLKEVTKATASPPSGSKAPIVSNSAARLEAAPTEKPVLRGLESNPPSQAASDDLYALPAEPETTSAAQAQTDSTLLPDATEDSAPVNVGAFPWLRQLPPGEMPAE